MYNVYVFVCACVNKEKVNVCVCVYCLIIQGHCLFFVVYTYIYSPCFVFAKKS